MTPDIIEIYFCPHCLKIGKTVNEFFAIGSSEYTCRCTCFECGVTLKIVDNLDRCHPCPKRLECLGDPTAIAVAVAVILKVPEDDNGNRTFTKVISAALRSIKGTINKYGTQCIKKDLETSQSGIYGNRKNISN